VQGHIVGAHIGSVVRSHPFCLHTHASKSVIIAVPYYEGTYLAEEHITNSRVGAPLPGDPQQSMIEARVAAVDGLHVH
jgi:hypothetical protein